MKYENLVKNNDDTKAFGLEFVDDHSLNEDDIIYVYYDRIDLLEFELEPDLRVLFRIVFYNNMSISRTVHALNFIEQRCKAFNLKVTIGYMADEEYNLQLFIENP